MPAPLNASVFPGKKHFKPLTICCAPRAPLNGVSNPMDIYSIAFSINFACSDLGEQGGGSLQASLGHNTKMVEEFYA